MSFVVKLKGHDDSLKVIIPDPVPVNFYFFVNALCARNFHFRDGIVRHSTTGMVSFEFKDGDVHEFHGGTASPASSTAGSSLESNTATIDLLANSYKEKNDVFAQVCGAGTYLANFAVQEMIDSKTHHGEVVRCICALERSLQCVSTFGSIPKREETVLINDNLQKLLTIMAEFSDNRLRYSKNRFSEESMNTTTSVSSHHSLQCSSVDKLSSSAQVISGIAAKRVGISVGQYYPQVVAVCGSMCVELQRLGLSREDSVAFSVVVTETKCQFLAVYMLKDTFPVLVALSSELNLLGTFEEQELVAQWCLRLVSFGKTTAQKLLLLPNGARVQQLNVRLDMSGYFAKPVRDLLQYNKKCKLWISRQSIHLNHIMQVYERLRVKCKQSGIDIKSVVLFPEGVVTVPGDDVPESRAVRSLLVSMCATAGFSTSELTYSPLILFPRLSATDGWCTDKPPPQNRQSYAAQLQVAVHALNTAGIAHLDLHPGNIMWKAVAQSSEVEIRIIDFEYSALFGRVIPEEVVHSVVRKRDRRYPFKDGDEGTVQIAKKMHNTFFLKAVIGWVHSTEDFYTHMYSKGVEILQQLKK